MFLLVYVPAFGDWTRAGSIPLINSKVLSEKGGLRKAIRSLQFFRQYAMCRDNVSASLLVLPLSQFLVTR